MRTKFITTAMLMMALAFLPLAAGAQTTATAPQDTEGVNRGGYNLQQSMELGYRFTDVSTHNGPNDLNMFNTFVNLHQGPRVLDQTFSMRSLENTGTLFDNMYFSSFGWGGDSNNAARFRLEKNKFYNFSASFRRDQNFFDYDLLGNPMNNPAAGLTSFPVTISPHAFQVVRRMADMNLTLMPQSQFVVRLGYSRNRADGPSLTTNHEAGDTTMLQPWNTTYQQWNVGFDMKFIPKTNISFDQFVQYGKNDTDTLLDPSSGIGTYFTTPLATAVGGYSAVEWGLVPTPSCILATGFAKTTGCNGYLAYNRYQRIRNTIPTSQLALQSRPNKWVELTGRYSYSWGTAKQDYSEAFNGLVTRTGEAGWVINGPMSSQIITGSGDFGVTVHITDKLELSNTFRFTNERAPSTTNFAESILSFKTGITPSLTGCYSTPANCTWSNPSMTPEELAYHLNQNYKYDTTELSYDFAKFGVRGGYRIGNRKIASLNERGVENWDITENTGLVGMWIRPSRQFRTNIDLEFTSNDSVDTRIVAKTQQHYKIRSTFQPVKQFTLTGTANILENGNDMAEVNYQGHNRNLGFTAAVNPNSKVSLDLSYNYNNYMQNAFMCFVDGTTGGFVPPGTTNGCPTNGYLYTSADYAWTGANPTNRYIYDTYEGTTHTGTFTVQFQPVKRLNAVLGYAFTSVDGNTPQLNQVVGLGTLNYTYHQPLASVSYQMAKNWWFNTYWNYDQYNEGSFTGPTAPRYFHDNRTTLALRYAF
ncbi:MAG: hypothetical protein ACRD3E_04090 [Terriglobales bacterium]